MKVLVVDDNALVADTLQETLEHEGCEVMTAKDGMDGYSAYLLFEPDLIITDIQMPRENGLKMMARVRTHDPMIQTIYMSGDIGPFQAILQEEEKRYPVTVFEKPFSLERLRKFISGTAGRPIQESAVYGY